MSLALESRSTQTCTSATLGLPYSKRHFWDSPALARKDYLLLPLSISGWKSRNSGLVPGNRDPNHSD